MRGLGASFERTMPLGQTLQPLYGAGTLPHLTRLRSPSMDQPQGRRSVGNLRKALTLPSAQKRGTHMLRRPVVIQPTLITNKANSSSPHSPRVGTALAATGGRPVAVHVPSKRSLRQLENTPFAREV